MAGHDASIDQEAGGIDAAIAAAGLELQEHSEMVVDPEQDCFITQRNTQYELGGFTQLDHN